MNRIFFLAAITLVIAGIALVVLSGGSQDGDGQDGEPLVVGTPLPTRAPAEAGTPDTQAGDPRLAALDISRLQVPKLGIDAPIVVMGILPDGTMASPGGPTEVAWYTFSSKPGQVGNVVMAGHLDYINYGAAVFYRLRDLRPGDEVRVVLADGTEVEYTVESVTEYEEASAPVADIVGRTPNEAITLITCAGSFDRANLLYSKRLVVRGARVVS